MVDPEIKNLQDISRLIQLNELTVLTGDNATGKSVIRKILPFRICEKLGVETKSGYVASMSQQLRTSSNAEWGGLSSIMQDTDWTATSDNTLDLFQNLMKQDNKYIVIDEPEIGLGEEMQLTIANMINDIVDERKNKDFKGILVITHSRIVVNTLKADNFLNIQGKTKEEWLNREIKAIDIDVFKEQADRLFVKIRDHEKK